MRNPVRSCSTLIRWGGGRGSFEHSSAGLSGPTQHSILKYVKSPAKHLEGVGLLIVFSLDFIRTSNVHVSFQIAASVLRHQGQHRTSCSPVPQTRDVALRSARLTKVPPAGNGTRVRLRQILKNVSSRITLNIGEIIKEKLPKPSENDFGYLLSSCLRKIQA